jgi:hypothetical protein
MLRILSDGVAQLVRFYVYYLEIDSSSLINFRVIEDLYGR